jgi:hypothetical protein
MPLPGGLWHNDQCYREFGFRPLTGAVELAVSEASQFVGTRPEAVTDLLQASLGHLGGLEPDTVLIDTLSVGDRHFLTTRLFAWLGKDEAWFTVDCQACNAHFDFPLRFSSLPVKPAGPSYPFCETILGAGTFKWRVPNGADQKVLALLPENADTVRVLLQHCLVEGKTAAGGVALDRLIADLTDLEIAQVEAALEGQAPEVATLAQATCPGCSRVNMIQIDPFLYLNAPFQGISTDVHRIASVYHWSEAEILSLPSQRRQRYLDLIDQAQPGPQG